MKQKIDLTCFDEPPKSVRDYEKHFLCNSLSINPNSELIVLSYPYPLMYPLSYP